MKKILSTISTLSVLLTVNAQYEFSSFTATGRGGATTFVTDYQAVGINPANLGWQYKFDDKTFAFGLLEMTYSVRSEALNKDGLKSIYRSSIGEEPPFTYDQKIQAAKDFTGAGFAINMDFSTLGMAYHDEKVGGFGFRVNDRIHSWVKLGQPASEILFLGYTAPYFDQYTLRNGDIMSAQDYESTYGYEDGVYNSDTDTLAIVTGTSLNPKYISELMKGSELQMSWYREYNLSYGRKILDLEEKFQLSIGAGVKYLQGFGLVDIYEENGNIIAYSSMSPIFGIDYGTAALSNPSTVEQTGKMPVSVGKGWGFDFGVSALIAEKLKLGFALTNIGSITWDGNVYTVQDTIMYETDNAGLESYNIFEQLGEITSNDGLFKWNGLETKTVQLPTMYRMGASIELGEKAEIGVDVLFPGNEVPGNFEGAIIGFGGDVRLLKWMKISAGFLSSKNYGTQIPLGLTLGPESGSYEFGIASRDAVSFFKDEGSTLSLAIGFLRFRI
ncbi:MAG: DUF5723 family protein [Bacteroidia bacterium]